MKKLVLTFVLLAVLAITAAPASASLVYSYSSTGSLFKELQSGDLKDQTTLVSGYAGMTDMAVSADAIYAVDGQRVRRWGIDGSYYGRSVDQDFVSVTTLNDGTIIAACGNTYSNAVRILDSSLAVTGTWISGYGGITDIAGGNGVVYAVTGGTIRRFVQGSQTSRSTNLGITTVAVLPGGDVVGYTGSSLITFDGATLATGTTIVSGYGGLLDISANGDGIFAADGSYIRRFALTGGTHTDISYSQGLNTVAASVPEPATVILLGIGGLLASARRKRA